MYVCDLLGSYLEVISAKPVTTVQDCVSTFLNMKSLDNSKETQDSWFKRKHDPFLTPTKWFWGLT